MNRTVPVAEPNTPFSFIKHARQLQNNTIAYLESLAAQGNFLRIRFGPVSLYFINHPDIVREVLVIQASKFDKPAPVKLAVKGLIGYNLFSSNGEIWLILRKSMQPAFHQQRIQHYTDIMVRFTQEMLAGWEEKQTIDTMQQIKVTLATILQHYRLSIPSEYPFEPIFRFNTRPRNGLPMQITRR